MVTSATTRKRQYEAAVRREAYYAKTDRPIKETVTKRPKLSVIYSSSLIKGTNGTISQLLKLQASERSVIFFGGSTAALGITALGLKDADASSDPVIQEPRFWTPAMVHAGVGLSTPTVSRSPWQTRVVKSKSATYSAPFSVQVANVTYDNLDNKAQLLYTNIKTRLGDESYSTFYLSPEMFNNYKQ